MSRLEDATFAVVEYIDCTGQRLMLAIFLILLGDDSFRRGRLINEVVLPFTGFAIMDWRIERCITAEASIHVNDISLGNIKAFRDQSDLIGVQVAAAFER